MVHGKDRRGQMGYDNAKGGWSRKASWSDLLVIYGVKKLRIIRLDTSYPMIYGPETMHPKATEHIRLTKSYIS